MNKIFKTLSAVILGFVITSPTFAYATSETNTPKLISEETVQLNSINQNSKSIVSKDFTLKTFEDNGVNLYSLDVNDPSYQEAANEYIIKLTGDTDENNHIQTLGVLLPGQSEYHNDTQYDGSAMTYSWKRNTAGIGSSANTFEGGQATSWTGSGKPTSIVLNQSITVKGIALSISWPPSLSISGYTGTWSSQPVASTSVGASFGNMKVSGPATSVTFSESGDVYMGSRIYRPTTYIKFSLFS